MTDQKGKSLKFKILFVVGAILILISLAITILILKTADISDAELGPSPFNVDESMISEDNLEYQTILEIGKEIQGGEKLKDYNHRDYFTEEPQETILILQEYLDKNKDVFDKIDLELFKKCKFPKWNIYKEDPQEGISYIQRLLRLMLYRIDYYILTNNFQSVKNDLILLNNIGDVLLQKSHVSLHLMVFLSIKSGVLSRLCDMINNNGTEEERKLELLNIKLNYTPSQSLKIAFHFEIKNVQEVMKLINEPNSIKENNFMKISNYPLFTSFYFQPNKSVKLFREKAVNIISHFESATNASYTKLNQGRKAKHRAMEFFDGNFGGIKFVEESTPVFRIITSKLMSFNNSCNQVLIAKKLLEFKINTGAFPLSLADLKIDPKLYTDIYTGAPFLYSAENGVLQSIGKDNKNASPELTTKKLSPDEIHEIIKGNRDNIIYLK